MTRILFICWGNICRSPAAELLFTDLARRAGREGDFFAASAGVSDEEEGNGVYPPMRRLLEARGLDCSQHAARMLRRRDYGDYDLLVCMDEATIGRTRRFFGGDPEDKIRNLLDYAGRPGEEIDCGCRALFEALSGGAGTLDLSGCREREALYAVLRRDMGLPDWSGSNLDALWDVLTDPEYRGKRFRLILPPEDSPLGSYANLVRETFREAGALDGDEAF